MTDPIIHEAERVIAEARAYLTVREYGWKYHASRGKVYAWIDEGRVEIIRDGPRFLRVKDEPPKNCPDSSR